ncbi:hypothetical protein MtrunA17_Chr1g0202481 [Medicago truncatula]|uniref:Uncharacterized protein n=1 Tax=Medicago truncatula TaxID=3880 RepID=A0A396JTU8_MEDTR|nr:hypothetical protein MtrunA17_Chr1g0202481 [Medicago truncatula]
MLKRTNQIQMSSNFQPLTLHKRCLRISSTAHNIPKSNNLIQIPTTLKTQP